MSLKENLHSNNLIGQINERVNARRDAEALRLATGNITKEDRFAYKIRSNQSYTGGSVFGSVESEISSFGALTHAQDSIAEAGSTPDEETDRRIIRDATERLTKRGIEIPGVEQNTPSI